ETVYRNPTIAGVNDAVAIPELDHHTPEERKIVKEKTPFWSPERGLVRQLVLEVVGGVARRSIDAQPIREVVPRTNQDVLQVGNLASIDRSKVRLETHKRGTQIESVQPVRTLKTRTPVALVSNVRLWQARVAAT